MLGAIGCGADNETEADKLAKTAGDPGPANPKAKSDTPVAQPKSYEDLMKRGDPTKSMPKNYPGNR
jgi:hypothetical protein